MATMRLLCAMLVLGVAAPGYAQGEVYDEFVGARSAAMGSAHKGLGTSNDTLFLNPAGMVMQRRYSIDLQYGFTHADALSHISLTALDSKSGPVAGALGYVHDRGDGEGVDANMHRFFLAAAYPIVDGLGFGLTFRHVRGSYNEGSTRRDIELYTGDIGLAAQLGDLGIGLVYQNVVRTDLPKFTPPTLGGGLSYRVGTFVIAADVNADIRRAETQWSYHAGLEYFAFDVIALRAGWQLAPFKRHSTNEWLKENIVSGGLGYVTPTGSAEITYVQSVRRGRNWTLAGVLKFFI